MECEIIEPERRRLELTYYRQNRRGKPMRISREKYLRSDINCGSYGCELCPITSRSQFKLDSDPPIYSNSCNFKHYLIPDAGFIIRQLDVLEELSNVILLQTVVEEVAKSSMAKYKRVRDGIKNRKIVYFLNEHHMDTYVERNPGESQEAYGLKLFLTSCVYFQEHFASRQIRVVVLSDDPEFQKKCNAVANIDSLVAYSGEEYVTKMTDQFKGLEDKLCRVPFNEDTGLVRGERPDFSFDPHLDMKLVQAGIKSGKYLQGAYRCWNFYEGFVRVDGDKQDAKEYLIQGTRNINRATDGDIIAIEVLPEDKWSIASGLVVTDVDEEPPVTSETVATGDEQEEEILAAAAAAKSKEKAEHIRPTARVVSIIRRKWLPCCGIIRKSLQENASYHYFLPDNKKLPRVRIETRNVERFEGQKIVVQIDHWPSNSRFPMGHYIKILGPVGTIETETEAVLHEHGVPHDPFSKAVEACLPTLPYIISEEEYQKRKSFKDLIVCSVDPPGCTDIDDTLHCRELDDGYFEVGVHIADVSHFVRPRNALDEEAAKRGTTVYLADRRIDMIPAVLSSNLCSLHAGTEKLVFSVIWKMTKEAKIVDTKFYKGIIQSKAAMTYAEAQAKLNSNDTDEITQSLNRLSFLAQVLRKQRFDNGALMLNTTEVSADGEAEGDDEESHAMVEEFMLLANCSVAEFTLAEFREYALLRRHPTPPLANFDTLLLAAETHGLNIIVDKGSKALNESLQNVPDSIKDILKVLTTRCMTQALYCCSGTTNPEEYHHFGLATKLYTHFTSPIRRYADLMVHRLLAAALRVEAVDPKLLDCKQMHDICENINLRHRMAQYASRASHNIHKSKKLKGKMEEHDAYVMFIRRNALQVFVPRYAMEGFIFFPKEGGFVYSEKEGKVTFGDVVFRSLDSVKVMLSLEEETDKVLFRLVKPYIKILCDPDPKN